MTSSPWYPAQYMCFLQSSVDVLLQWITSFHTSTPTDEQAFHIATASVCNSPLDSVWHAESLQSFWWQFKIANFLQKSWPCCWCPCSVLNVFAALFWLFMALNEFCHTSCHVTVANVFRYRTCWMLNPYRVVRNMEISYEYLWLVPCCRVFIVICRAEFPLD